MEDQVGRVEQSYRKAHDINHGSRFTWLHVPCLKTQSSDNSSHLRGGLTDSNGNTSASYRTPGASKSTIWSIVALYSRQTTNVIGPLHECKKVRSKSPTPVRHSRMNQARSERERGKKRQERQRPWGWWKERQSNKIKIWGTKTIKAYLGTAKVNKAEGGTLIFPMRPSAPSNLNEI